LAQIINAWPISGGPARPSFWVAFAVTAGFAALARAIRGVSLSGAVAGAGICFVLYIGAGPGAFAALVLVFALAWTTTRLGHQRKEKLGTAERVEGRSASQVLANLGVAAVCAALYGLRPDKISFLAGMAGAFAEAAADTVSSEIGQAESQNPRLITTWESVSPGTNGGISLIGTLTGTAAAALVSVICVLAGLLPWRWASICTVAGVLGMVADSFLGASLERRRWMNNDSVNFLSTLIAALAAFVLA